MDEINSILEEECFILTMCFLVENGQVTSCRIHFMLQCLPAICLAMCPSHFGVS